MEMQVWGRRRRCWIGVSWHNEGNEKGIWALGTGCFREAVSDPVWEKPPGMTGIFSSVVCLGRM